jgi:hypothetical protein
MLLGCATTRGGREMPSEPCLDLAGVTEGIAITQLQSGDVQVQATLVLQLTNKCNRPVILLSSAPPVIATFFGKDTQDVADGLRRSNVHPWLYSGTYYPSIDNSSGGLEMRHALDHAMPPTEITRVMEVGKSWSFRATVSAEFLRPGTGDVAWRHGVDWSEALQDAPIATAVRVRTWPITTALEPQPGLGRRHLFAETLRKRWTDFGILWTGDLDSRPIPIDLKAAARRSSEEPK